MCLRRKSKFYKHQKYKKSKRCVVIFGVSRSKHQSKEIMKILLVFDSEFEIDKNKLESFLSQQTQHIKFDVSKENIGFDKDFISKPESFDHATDVVKSAENYNRVYIFTNKPYEDNYFFHGFGSFVIFSFYGWSHLTNLSKTNGILFFIVDSLALNIDPTDFRHNELTGCIYDFLLQKTGIDDGMRQARICPNCLDRLETNLTKDEEFSTLEGIKELMNALSNSSKWNKDIFEEVEIDVPHSSIKRSSKNDNEIHVAIASPGDAITERETLLNKLEIQFRRANHEDHCKHRLIVHG